jgi:type I restriction enzyme S subunit
LLSYFETYKFKKDILRFEEGGVRQYLFFENFSQIKIPLPSYEEQKKITEFINEIDLRVNVIKKQITQTQTDTGIRWQLHAG